MINSRSGTSPRAALPIDDIQALVGSGMPSLPYGCYWLLHVDDAQLACLWLQRLLASGLLKTVADLGKRGDGSIDELISVAISYAGLLRLGLQQAIDYPFPSAFTEGMGNPARARAFGDDLGTDWRWSDVNLPERAPAQVQAHILLAHFHRGTPSAAAMKLLADASLSAAGIHIVGRLNTNPDCYTSSATTGETVVTEPFGFRDGIAQPVLRGLRESVRDALALKRLGKRYADRVVAPGEFLLGHENEYGDLAYCPDVVGWKANGSDTLPAARFAANGSYLAVRQLQQDVDGFRAFDKANPPRCPGAPSLAEQMVGRFRDGRPLVNEPFAGVDLDDFRYRMVDQSGFQCPRAAHIRRANPRDLLGLNEADGVAASKRHRLLRRGRAYREQGSQGLLFIALNADLERQFEFVQQRWLGNRSFGDVADSDEPFSQIQPPHSFSTQALPIGQRHEGLNRYVQPIGGGYFLLPGLAALQFIAGGPRSIA